MLKLKNVSNTFLLILLMGSIHAFGQDPFIVFGQDISKNDTMRYVGEFPHWQSVSKLTKPNYLLVQRQQFKSNAYVETYVEAVLDHPAWMFTMLNQFASLRNTTARNTPHIVFNVRYKPLNNELTNYEVLLAVRGSTDLTLNFNAITQAANFLGLNGRTFPTPQDASDEVAQTIQEAMRLISREVGSSLSPNLMVKYNNEVFWNGHEILINKEGYNQITLQPLGKFGVPLSPEQVSWTNASNGVVDMTGLQNKSITLTRLDTAASLTVNIKRRSSFVLDTKTLLRPIVLQVLEERLAAVLDELVNTRVDSVNNANSVSALVRQVEAGNVPLEGSEVLVPLFAQPLVLTDSTGFKRNDTGIKARTLRELRRAKAIRQVLRTKVNTRAFCNLVIQKPDKLDELMDELLLNSGQLLGELVLNLGDPAMLQSARNIIITYLNENMTRLAGSNFGMANDEPITVTRVQSAAPVVFDPAKRLYIANNVDFPGKEAFKNEMTTYLNALDTPLYVFINYSQDLSTETYLKRTIGTRPAGLPKGAQFVTLTLVNIPGSVQYQVFGSKAGVQVNTSLSAKDFLMDYVKADVEEIFPTTSMIAVNFDECTDCNLWETPSGKLFYADKTDYAFSQGDELLFNKLDIVYYILKDGKRYQWNHYLESYYNEESERYVNDNSSWYDGAILGLGEVGKDFLDPQTYKEIAQTTYKLGFATILGGTSGADLGVGLGPEEYQQLFAQMQEWEGGDWIKFFTKIAYGAVSSYATTGLIITANGTKWVRVGSWMSKSEYDAMLKSMKAQSRKGDMHHVLLNGREGFRKQAKNGWVYVEYDIPSNTFIGVGGEDGWGIVFGETSTYGKFYISKGYQGIGMPDVRNINLLETK